MGKKPSLILLVARELGMRTLQDALDDKVFDIKAVVTHYYEVDLKTEREYYKHFVDLCEQEGIPLITVNKNQKALKIISQINPDFIVCNCYKYIIPEEYLSMARIASLNMHQSLLPKYKGLKPLKKAIQAGEQETGTSIHLMTGEVDGGKVLNQERISIEAGDEEKDLFLKLLPTQYPLMKKTLLGLYTQNG